LPKAAIWSRIVVGDCLYTITLTDIATHYRHPFAGDGRTAA
jgi:hypothetical protein